MDALSRLPDLWLRIYGLHMVEISILIVLVWSIDRWLRLDTSLRCTLWLIALAKVYIPPFLTVPMPVVLQEPAVALAALPPVLPAVGPEPVPLEPDSAVRVSLPLILFLLWCFWVVGAAGVVLWKNLSIAGRLAASQRISPDVDLTLLDAVPVLAGRGIASPVVVGFLRPRIYLPAEWSTWSHPQLRSVLAHELEHCRGRDGWILIGQALALILFGLNPLVWVLHGRLTLVRELRCDERALDQTGMAQTDYGRLLYGIVRRRAGLAWSAVGGLCFTENGRAIKERFQHLLSLKEETVRPRSWRHVALAWLVALSVLPLSAVETEPTRAAVAQDMRFPVAIGKVRTAQAGLLVEADGLKLGAVSQEGRRVVRSNLARVRYAAALALMDGVVSESRQASYIEDKSRRIAVYVNRELDGRWVDAAKLDSLQVRWLGAHDAGVPGDTEPALGIADVMVNAQSRLLIDRSREASIGEWEAEVRRLKKTGVEWITLSVGDGTPEADRHRIVGIARDLGMKVSDRKYTHDRLPRESVAKPRLKRSAPPVYPARARREGLEGKVLVKVRVDTSGKVEDALVLRGSQVFRQAALDAARQYEYEPARRDGEAVSAWITVPIKFSLDGQDRYRGDAADAAPDSVAGFKLHRNLPDPFNPETIIKYNVAEPSHVDLVIHAGDGRIVRTLVSGVRPSGLNQVRWDGKDDSGKLVPSGVYVYRMKAGDFEDLKTIMLMR